MAWKDFAGTPRPVCDLGGFHGCIVVPPEVMAPLEAMPRGVRRLGTVPRGRSGQACQDRLIASALRDLMSPVMDEPIPRGLRRLLE
jgi:hypothetical protein